MQQHDRPPTGREVVAFIAICMVIIYGTWALAVWVP